MPPRKTLLLLLISTCSSTASPSQEPDLRRSLQPTNAIISNASSCSEVQKDGIYMLNNNSGRQPFFCLASSPFGGGWTRVGRLSAPFDGYCSLSSSPPTYDLTRDPSMRAGKVTDDDAIRYGLGGGGGCKGYEVLLSVVGTEGKGQYIKGQTSSCYATTSRQTVKEWTCADGTRVGLVAPTQQQQQQGPAAANSTSSNGTASVCGCGPSSGSSGTAAMDIKANTTPQLFLGCLSSNPPLGGPDPSWRFGLHAGGGVCGLDNRGAYDVDVFIRPL